MKTELFTISKIFHENIFRIPDYQRGYSWQEPQLKDFWLDLEQLAAGKSHYTGVLTLEPVDFLKWQEWSDDIWIISSRGYSPYYVVDGQQRLTTVVILLQCVVEKAGDQELNYTQLKDIRRKFIFDERSDSIVRSYIFGYERDNPSYEFLKTRIFMEVSDKYSVGEDTIYTENLLLAKKFFESLLSKMTHEELEVVYRKVTQQLLFNVYEIAKEVDVSVAFETMNNRGKPLTTLELLKNRLIYLSQQVSPDGMIDLRLRSIINDAWKTVYHYIGKNADRPLKDDDFLGVHLYHFYNSDLVRDLPHEEDAVGKFLFTFREALSGAQGFLLGELFNRKRLFSLENSHLPEISPSFINDFAMSLKRSVETFYGLSTPDDFKGISARERILLERIGRIRGYTPSVVLLEVYLKKESSKKRIEFLEVHERWLFCSTLKGNGSIGFRAGYQQMELIKYIKGRQSIDALIVYFNNQVAEWFKEGNISELLHDWVRNGPGYYGWRSINYFLYEYEVYLSELSKSSRQKIDWRVFDREDYDSDYVSVEHIYPQKARAGYWVERFGSFNSTQKRLLRNSLGNLLALSVPKNASLSNKPFPEKVGRDIDTVGYRYGSYSENEVALQAEWSAQQILERGINLLDFMEKRWKITIGDRAQKVKALGLSFMLD